MKPIINFARQYGYGFYLGCVLSVYGLTFTTWGFWVVTIPTVLLVAWRGRTATSRVVAPTPATNSASLSIALLEEFAKCYESTGISAELAAFADKVQDFLAAQQQA